MSSHQSSSEHTVGHETHDFDFFKIAFLIPITMIALCVFFCVCIFWFRGARSSEVIERQAMGGNLEMINKLHAQEKMTLTQYKWIDKEKNIVQIPIARAMEILVEEKNQQHLQENTTALKK